jgi:predicted phage tail protein
MITVLPVPPVAVDDHYTTVFNTPLTVAAPGVLANDTVTGGAVVEQLPVSGRGALAVAPNGGFTYVPPVGFVGTTSFGYRTVSAHGTSDATITITVGAPTTVQPPTNLAVTAVARQWTPPALGPTPTGWVFEAGVDAGQALVTLPTGDARPAFSFTAPAGSYFVRIRAVDGAAQSAPSSEIRVFVAQPLPPAAPTGLVGLANGAALTLAWQPSHARGEVSSFALDVTGAASLTLPLDAAAEGFSFAGVPAGTYTFAVRALNAYGSSPASNAVTLTFPTACSGVPDTPTNVVVQTVGHDVSARWDAASTGAAPASYLLQVTGTFNGGLPLTARSFETTAPSGTYAISVVALNACGASTPSPARTVTVP